MLHWNVREEGRWIYFEDVCVCGGAESWWVVRSRLNRTEGEAGGDPASAHILPRYSKQRTNVMASLQVGSVSIQRILMFLEVGAPARHCCTSRVTKGQLSWGLNTLSTLGGIKCWLAFWNLPKELRAYIKHDPSASSLVFISYEMQMLISEVLHL